MSAFCPDRFIPYGRPSIDEEDITAVVDVLKGDFLTTGPAVLEFEALLTDKTGAMYASVCNSGTAALHLAYLALGLDKGDQVIVPAVSFCATANAAAMCGADVIFADVDHQTGLVTENGLKEAAQKADPNRLKALSVVHLNGQLVNMEMASAFAKKHSLILVEDACHALGSSYDIYGQAYQVGQCAHSDLCCFSFHPVKNIAMGEGGAVTTNSNEFKSKTDQYRNHGLEMYPDQFVAMPGDAKDSGASWHREMHVLGYNYRAPDILCALASSQLKKLTKLKAERETLVGRYDRAFSAYPDLLRTLPKAYHQNPCWHLYPVFIDFDRLEINRETVIQKLKAARIGTQVHYWPIPSHPYWVEKSEDCSYPNADSYYKAELSLPLFSGLSFDEQDYVIRQLITVLRDGNHDA
ncbi:UDP-4-amino-4,6-dideoxy-N-acetyl-beta-L-altrosamine transaminase [Curvivirga aplysinae]|uniref:UDP-4-amino-4, 6-dideoxy-N-acetyl-beta-L-altrosamine transaminase n=1 Tax=Curvivirga aplysinae TaxID=2529852 RepID=UPI0012BCFF9E|nr:UDP-4-amino-4,6-dideoxy-N-acetyl-beta-L-altrosamine transaminase [Curvivirga aplysinae]MTI11413.1 UDP-4-amino-4,6-dideoxy-N-acetyl-beta-L-altrosamine transaminase [Curvivirga aplysinae]